MAFSIMGDVLRMESASTFEHHCIRAGCYDHLLVRLLLMRLLLNTIICNSEKVCEFEFRKGFVETVILCWDLFL
jgi:hypothetical protein